MSTQTYHTCSLRAVNINKNQEFHHGMGNWHYVTKGYVPSKLLKTKETLVIDVGCFRTKWDIRVHPLSRDLSKNCMRGNEM